MKRKDSLNEWEMAYIIIVGGGIYLLMEHPFIFWFVALPIAVLLIVKFIKWLSNY